MTGHSSLQRVIILILLVTGQIGCLNDPFDPWLGPRNPRPGALRYLSGRNDILESDKKALLDYQPCSRKPLKQLFDAPAREVRFLVAINTGADPDILKTLSADPEPAVRQGVAMNRNAPQALLLKLSKDKSENVRYAVAHNPNRAP
jgi:hypothetical protein